MREIKEYKEQDLRVRIKSILDIASGCVRPNLPDFLVSLIDEPNKLVRIDSSYDEQVPLLDIKCTLSKGEPCEIFAKYDVWDFLSRYPGNFELISCYRFLEHVPVDKLLTFIYLMRTKCVTRGYCDIIVPNWNDLRKINIDKGKQLMTNEYLTLVYELCNYPGDPHACIFTPKKLRQFFELERAWKHIYTIKNYNFSGRNIYFRSVYLAI